MLRCYAWLPLKRELPQAVQHNANGDRVVISVHNHLDQTVQVVFENNEAGEMVIRLRGWGNDPIKLGNMDRTNFSAIIPFEAL